MWSGYSEQGRGALERGPGGFSLNVPGAQEAAQAGQASAPVRGGQRGGGMAPTGNVVIPEAQDKTLQTLLRLGEGRLDKEVQRLQGEAYVQGAARAAEGVAMQEVLDEQPAWANVFGDSATVEGALDGRVSKRDLRPDDWSLIWPDLNVGRGTSAAKRV